MRAPISLGRAEARARTGDRTGRNFASRYTQQPLGRRRQDRDAGELRTRRERRGVRGAQRGIDARGIGGLAQCQSPGTRQVCLVNVASGNVLLRLAHAFQVFLRQFFAQGRKRQRRRRRVHGLRGSRLQVSDQSRVGRCGALFRDGKHLVGREIVYGKRVDTQREGGERQARAWQVQTGLDFRSQLVARVDDPAARERQAVA